MNYRDLHSRWLRRAARLFRTRTLLATCAAALLSACSEEIRREGRDAASCETSLTSDSSPPSIPDSRRPLPEEPTLMLPEPIAGIAFPNTSLARAAAQLAFEASPEVLYNHLMRSYLFGSLYLRNAGTDYDEELAFVGTMLHDLGLLERFMSPTERFELDGADAAMAFLDDWAVAPERAEIVWDAIALHMQVSIATRKRPEIALVSVGAVMDASGRNLPTLSPDDVSVVLEAFPRIGFKQSAVATMIRLCEQKPIGQILHPFADVGRRHVAGFSLPTIEDLMLGAPFEE